MRPDAVIFTTNSESETQQLAARFAKTLRFPAVVLLEGVLGSGKTNFVKGVVSGLGGDPRRVHSPTFSLVNEYRTGTIRTVHIDLYRLDEAREQYSIGLDEILATEQLVIIEWAEKLHLETPEAIRVRLEIHGEDRRRISIWPAPDDLLPG